jgi:ribonuclease HII
MGIVAATRLAMMRAVAALRVAPDALLIDAVKLPELRLHQRVFNFADSISLSVAAASILAKTARDASMRRLDKVVPGFGFAAHKGYGTRMHAAALSELGPCWAHRHSFAPIRQALALLHSQPSTLNAQ